MFSDILNRMKTLNGSEYESQAEHCVFNIDEECFMAIGGTDVKIVGEKGRTKHEKKGADSRVSITVLRLGNAAGWQGATILL